MEREKESSNTGAGDTWWLFCKPIYAGWETVSASQQLLWTIIVLLPKYGGNYLGIGLLNLFWKVVEVFMDNRLKTLDYHDCLHGFLAGCSTGIVTTEAKIAWQLV